MCNNICYDHDIVSVSGGTVVFKKDKELFSIDLSKCCETYKKEHSNASVGCVGDRNITEKYFALKTENGDFIIKFKKVYVFDFFGKKTLSGTQTARFLQFQRALNLMGFRTYDLT